jgi:hypothetical protein
MLRLFPIRSSFYGKRLREPLVPPVGDFAASNRTSADTAGDSSKDATTTAPSSG